MLSAAAPVPGSCVGLLEWSPTQAASSQSALAGVLAGFVFGGIVVMVSVRVATRSEEAARALKLLLCAFFGLVVVAYLFADLAGDSNCLRANSEEVISGGILGTFAIVMIVSLAWLTVAYEMHARGVLRFLRHLIYVASAFVVLLLCTSSYSGLQAEFRRGPPLIVGIFIYVVGGLFYFFSILGGSRSAALLRSWVARRIAGSGHGSGSTADGARQERGPVDRCIWAALSYLGIAAIADAFVLGSSDTVWDHPQAAFAYVVAWASLLLSISVLTLALRAIPPEDLELGGVDPKT
jgi:predicted membrane channel-forming protein YqfA (hemolysin III family)